MSIYKSTRSTLFFGFFVLLLFSCRSTNYLSGIEASKQTVNPELAPTEDPAIKALIEPYKKQLDDQMNEVIGHTIVDLKKERPESTLGNWMADAIQRQAEKQLDHPIAFAIQNQGGIRISNISKGPIPRGKIFELMPFDNMVVVLSLDSTEVQEFAQHIVQSGGWPVSHSIKITQDDTEALDIMIQGMPLKSGMVYQVALPDYVANGGSDSGFLKGKPQQKLDLFIRDVLISDLEEYTANGQVIESVIEGRMILKDQ